jgi:adenylylsulfate kinase
MSAHLFHHAQAVSAIERQQLNGHAAICVWFTGLSGSGKSTLANAVLRELHQRGIHAYLLDGDNTRMGLNKDLGFSADDRTENIRRVGEVCKLMCDAGLVVLAAFISPFAADRAMVRGLLGPGQFIEVHVECSVEACEQRDPKGLYKKARAGEIRDFTGIDAPYETPLNPELKVLTEKNELAHSVEEVMHYLTPLLKQTN